MTIKRKTIPFLLKFFKNVKTLVKTTLKTLFLQF